MYIKEYSSLEELLCDLTMQGYEFHVRKDNELNAIILKINFGNLHVSETLPLEDLEEMTAGSEYIMIQTIRNMLRKFWEVGNGE